jgi:hypothetical protein
MVDKIKHVFIVLVQKMYFQQNQCFNIKKHAVHNIHRLALAPMLVGIRGTTLSVHALTRHWLPPLLLRDRGVVRASLVKCGPNYCSL